MNDAIVINNLESITKSGKDRFKLFQTQTLLSPGDGIKFLPTIEGYEICKTNETGSIIVNKKVESETIVYPSSDTTIQAIALNTNTINRFDTTIVLRDTFNNLASWSTLTFYFQYFNNTLTQVGNVSVQTVGSITPTINVIGNNFQVIIFISQTGAGGSNQLFSKSSTVVQTTQFAN